MSSAWGKSFGSSWGNSWGTISGGGSNPASGGAWGSHFINWGLSWGARSGGGSNPASGGAWGSSFVNWGLSWGSFSPAPIVQIDTNDWARNYRRYRKRLEIAAKAADSFNQSKYINQAVHVASVVKDMPIASPVIAAVAESVSLGEPVKVDFTALKNELEAAIAHVNAQIEEHMKREEEETMLLMLLH